LKVIGRLATGETVLEGTTNRDHHVLLMSGTDEAQRLETFAN